MATRSNSSRSSRSRGLAEITKFEKHHTGPVPCATPGCLLRRNHTGAHVLAPERARAAPVRHYRMHNHPACYKEANAFYDNIMRWATKNGMAGRVSEGRFSFDGLAASCMTCKLYNVLNW